jgi:hypothetical protein
VTKRDHRGGEKSKRLKHSGRYDESLDEFAVASVADKALVHLLRERFVVKPPQDGPLELLVSTEVGPPISYAFAVDDARGCAWIGDWGVLRRIDFASGEIRDLALGDFRGVHDVVVEADGGVLVLAAREEEATGNWLPPSNGSVKLGVLRSDGSTLEILVTADGRLGADVDPPVGSLAVATGQTAALGTFVGPHDEGLGLYAKDGALLRRFSVRRPRGSNACGSIDPNGRFVVVTSGECTLTRHDLQSGNETLIRGEFDGVLQASVLVDGTVLVLGTDYDVYCVGDRGSRRLGLRTARFHPTTDGHSIVAIQHRREVSVIDVATGEPSFTITTLGNDEPKRAMVAGSYLHARGELFHRIAVSKK